jgi:hypothetical protein
MLAAAFALLAGCASTPKTASTGIDFSRFNQGIAVDEIRLASTVAMELSDADRAVLASKLRIALVSALTETTRVSAPGPGVLRLQVTVTDIDATRPAVNVISAALVMVPVDRGGIAFEARFFDGAGGQPVALSTERHKGSMLDVKGNFSHYGHAIGALGKWGEALGQSMAQPMAQPIAKR